MKNTKRFVLLAIIGLVATGAASAQTLGRRGSLSSGMAAVYEKYGLTYNQDKGAYLFNNKIVGLLVDELGRGRVFLSPGGEIHLKVSRDADGKITGIAELDPAEYAQVLEDIDAAQITLRRHMEGMREMMDRRMGNIQPPQSRRLNVPQPPQEPRGTQRSRSRR